MSFRTLAVLAAGVVTLGAPLPASPQTPGAPVQVRPPLDARFQVFAGGELERYLRAIHTPGSGAQPSLGHPWVFR